MQNFCCHSIGKGKLNESSCQKLLGPFKNNLPQMGPWQLSKMLIIWMNTDQKLLETEFLIAICRPTGDKWQSKTLYLAIFYPPLWIVKSVFNLPQMGP